VPGRRSAAVEKPAERERTSASRRPLGVMALVMHGIPYLGNPLASPAMRDGGTCPLDSSNNLFIFSVNFRAAQSDSDFVRLPLQTCLYSATAAAVAQSRLYMNLVRCIIYSFRVILRATKSFMLFCNPLACTMLTSPLRKLMCYKL